MKRLVIVGALVGATMLITPAAQAWVTLDEGRGWNQAKAVATFNSNRWRVVDFQAGHLSEGVAGTFQAGWVVQCAGGFEYSKAKLARDTLRYYWSPWQIRIPYGQGACSAAIVVKAVSPKNVKMYAAVQVR